jgi:vesicle coat complex subunit
MNTTIASAIADSVVKLLNHTTDLVRKKAILALQIIVNIALNLETSSRRRNGRL